jgi:hypothetical protein
MDLWCYSNNSSLMSKSNVNLFAQIVQVDYAQVSKMSNSISKVVLICWLKIFYNKWRKDLKKKSWFTFYWSWLATCICNNANTNRNLVFCYHQFCNYMQLHHLQLYLQLWTTFEISTTILWLHYNYWRFHASMWMILMYFFIQAHGSKSH